MEFGRASHQVPTPLGEEMEREHERELEEQSERAREVAEVVRRRRPWWALWRREGR